ARRGSGLPSGVPLARDATRRPPQRADAAMNTFRSFVAVELSPEIRRDLGRLRTRLDTGQRGVKFAPTDNLHLTIKFLGDVPETDLGEIGRRLSCVTAAHQPFEMQLRGAGVFPPHGHVRIVWAGLEEPSGKLQALVAGLETMFAELGF